MKKRFVVFLIIFLIMFLIPFIYAGVVINEVELNPPGTDIDEYVELYNNETPVNLSGWYITDKDNNKFFLPNITINNFYVFDLFPTNSLVNTNENISLFNNYEVLQDSINLSDGVNNNKTWQRVPDGFGAWVFKNNTRELPNQLTIIQNKSISKSCIFEDEEISLNASISGFCIENVTFSVYINGIWENYTGINIGGVNYSVSINISQINVTGKINWTVYAKDCFNRTKKDGTKNFSIYNRTKLLINPVNPDGWAGWYVTEPIFQLTNPDAALIWYRWDGTGELLYSSPFNLDNIPNSPPKKSAGILELNWWSNICMNESEQSKLLKIDLTKPTISDLTPENNSIVYNNAKPTIQAYLDEVYQSNSGIDKASVIMKLDNAVVAANVFDADTLDAIVRYNPVVNLSEGLHNVSVYVKDKAGNENQTLWKFYINLSVSDFNLTVYSPLNKSYGSRRVIFNITATKIVEKIEYINWNDARPRWSVLCKDCKEYGFKRIKTRNLNEGKNNITIKATDEFGNSKEKNIMLFVDSREPRIHKILPTRNQVVNGSGFYIKYSEDNLKQISVSWNPSQILINCNKSGVNQECFISLNLSAYDNNYIEFWFNISDYIRSVKSKMTRVKVDTTSPELNISSPFNQTYGRYVPFNLNVSEKASIEYYDSNELSPRWRRLCSNCDSFNTKRAFSKGNHKILIKAKDKAGNSDEDWVEFLVNY